MKYLTKGSLRYYLSIPQVKQIDLSKYPAPEAAKRVYAYWNGKGKDEIPYPEKEAISFYALNHLVAVLQSKYDFDEVLPDWAQGIVEEYVRCLSEQGQRLYAYILLIITRESRHMHAWKGGVTPSNLNQKWTKFHEVIKGGDSITVAKTFCTAPPHMPLGEYVASVEDCFFKGSFSGGYGGKPWGNISQCLRRMLYGETSMVTMVDTAYTLAHNNGPMFNKGMLYHMYEHTKGTLLRILDIQRAGQIPEALLNGELPPNHVDTAVKDAVTVTKEKFPSAFGEYVDWTLVESLSPNKGKYSQEKAKMPTKVVAPKIIHGQKFVHSGSFKVMPNVTVATMKREAA